MKTNPFRSLTLPAVVMAGFITLGAGCNKQERTDVGAKAESAMVDAKAAMAKSWDNVKAYTYEKRAEFTSASKAMTSELEAKASKLRADYSEAKASASRKAAMAEMKNAEADYKQKLDALGSATADTWDAAKNNVIAAWDRFEAAARKATTD
ncbi:hypothetical protein [Horticoccus sp. 23ND18S-11]|uniref:hypothetical protein n=1 Tax=Horticoccus sp. 23ND18S-11 TaxID=3391832 RepID=UPI0039C9E301